MALPRSKVEIQNSWLAWLDQRAIDDGLDDDAKAALKLALSPEVLWLIHILDFETNLSLRLAKITSLLADNEGNLSSFDVYWSARKDFLEWMQT
jgi:hypothetical protein